MIGEEIQKLSVIQNIPALLKEDYEGCLKKIIPRMNQGLIQGSIEYHWAASGSVQTIVQQRLVQSNHFKIHFLKAILTCIDSKDSETSKTWLNTLLESIKILKEDAIISEILPLAESKAKLSEPVSNRIISCRLLGKIAESCSAYNLQKSVLPCIQSLSQDVNKSVRATICAQLSSCARPLSATYERDILPLLNECVNDEEGEVVAAAFNTLVQSLPHVNSDVLKSSFLPLARKIIENTSQSLYDGDILVYLTDHYGKLCTGLSSVMTEQDKVWFIEAFVNIADQSVAVAVKFKDRVMERTRNLLQTRNQSNMLVECRINCAKNMATMINLSREVGGSNPLFARNLYPMVCIFCSDAQLTVRKAIASVLHQVISALGKSNGFVMKELIKLMNDDSEDVLQAFIPHIKECLEAFSSTDYLSPDVVDETCIELGRSLFNCELEVSVTYNWRIQASFFKQLEVLPKCLPSGFIFSQFVPLLRKRLFTHRTVACRMAIVRTLLVFLRFNTNTNQRNDIRATIISELCCSKNFYNRAIYVRSIPNIIEIFSSYYFRAHFFVPTIALMGDKVANIRFMMCDLMPMLRCIAAADKTNTKLLALCDSALEKTKNEKDTLVLEHIRGMSKTMGKLKLDTIDAAKYKEEKTLDALAAASKDVKTHFPNLNSRTIPLRHPLRTAGRMDRYDQLNNARPTRNDQGTFDLQELSSKLSTLASTEPLLESTTQQHIFEKTSPDIISNDSLNNNEPPTSSPTNQNQIAPQFFKMVRCISPDIIRNSKSMVRDNLPDIALNNIPNTSESFLDSHTSLDSPETMHTPFRIGSQAFCKQTVSSNSPTKLFDDSHSIVDSNSNLTDECNSMSLHNVPDEFTNFHVSSPKFENYTIQEVSTEDVSPHDLFKSNETNKPENDSNFEQISECPPIFNNEESPKLSFQETVFNEACSSNSPTKLFDYSHSIVDSNSNLSSQLGKRVENINSKLAVFKDFGYKTKLLRESDLMESNRNNVEDGEIIEDGNKNITTAFRKLESNSTNSDSNSLISMKCSDELHQVSGPPKDLKKLVQPCTSENTHSQLTTHQIDLKQLVQPCTSENTQSQLTTDQIIPDSKMSSIHSTPVNFNQSDTSSLGKDCVLRNKYLRPPSISASVEKIVSSSKCHKSSSSGIPTVNKSPRRSLVLINKDFTDYESKTNGSSKNSTKPNFSESKGDSSRKEEHKTTNLKRSSFPDPVKSSLPVRASRNSPTVYNSPGDLVAANSKRHSLGALSGDNFAAEKSRTVYNNIPNNLVAANSKRHSLGALSGDNFAAEKSLSRKGAERPQSLVLNSSRLPVRSSSSTSLQRARQAR